MTVRKILDTKGRHVFSIGVDATISEAAKLLADRRIGSVLVMTGEHLEGVLSERDIVRALSERGAAILDEPVRNIMTTQVMTCRWTDTISLIMEKMTDGKFRHLPVVEEQRVVGVISIGDVVKHRLQEYENEQEALRDYIKTA